jgi:hypothetical protein
LLQTAEIIALLYEATQGPPLPIEAPALNPTGGVTVKKPADLDFKKDPTRPGGGVFILRGKENDFKDVPDGVVISTSEEGKDSEGEATLPATAVASSVFFIVRTIMTLTPPIFCPRALLSPHIPHFRIMLMVGL